MEAQNKLAEQHKKSLNPEWRAKLEETLDFSKKIITGNAQLAHIEMGLKIEDTFSKPTIRGVFKGEAGGIGFSVVKVLLSRFVESFGFSKKMDDMQLESLTVDTLENFQYETLHDVILFLKMARSGKLGTTNRGIDSNLIFGEWFPKYLEKKSELRELDYERNKAKIKSIPVTFEDVKVTYNKIYEKKRIEKIQEHIDFITKDFDRQLLEDLIIDWQKDEERKPYVHMLKAKRKKL